MITITNADKALKDYYLQAITAQLNDNISPFFSAIEKTTEGVYGKEVKISVVRGNTDSVIACAEDYDLPTAYKNRYLEISVPLKNIYGTIEVSDKSLRSSRDSSGAFVNLVNAEMEGLISSAKYNFQRMLYGDGKGILTKITAADGNAAVNHKYVLEDVSKLAVGMTVDVIGNTAVTEGLKIIDIAVGSKTVTFSGAVSGFTTNALICVAGTYGNELI